MTAGVMEVVRVAVLDCHRCSGSLLFSIEVPHSFRRADGTEVSGRRTVGLCERCDRETAEGRGLIAFCTLTPVVQGVHSEEIGVLIKEWLSALPSVTSPIDDADETERAWRAGGC